MKRITLSFVLLCCAGLIACSGNPSAGVTPTLDSPDEAVETSTPLPNTSTVTGSGNAANADVVFVRAEQSQDGTWTFAVTVRHPDTGWEDYADGWDVVLPDGTVLKRSREDPFTRLLTHPHVDEQPFTRSQSGLEIPEGVGTVTVRAHDLVDGYGGRMVTVDLTRAQGESFEVIRPGE